MKTSSDGHDGNPGCVSGDIMLLKVVVDLRWGDASQKSGDAIFSELLHRALASYSYSLG